VNVLERLAGSPHKPALVVTPPDRPRGRGRRLASPPVADAARARGIYVLQTPNVNDAEVLEAIDAVDPGALAVCQFGQLIREPLLSRYLLLNVHTSLLPRWRGAAPIERALMAGDEVTGATIFRVTAGLDSGPVAAMEEVPIEPGDTAGTLGARLAAVGASLLIGALDRVEAGTLELVEQPADGVTYAGKIEAHERRLDSERPAEELERTVRALAPEIGAYVELPSGERLGVSRAAVVDGSLAPGGIGASDGRLVLGTSEGALELLEVRPPGGRAMPAADYLRGHPLR
jgi:methionyl-tRNA formyltransferase